METASRNRRERALSIVPTGLLLAGLAPPLLPLLWTLVVVQAGERHLHLPTTAATVAGDARELPARLFSDALPAVVLEHALGECGLDRARPLLQRASAATPSPVRVPRQDAAVQHRAGVAPGAAFAVLLIPLFVLITRIGRADLILALIVPWVAPAYGIFLMRSTSCRRCRMN